MRQLFLDSNVLLYAAGVQDSLRDDCRAVMRGADEGKYRLHVSAEALQEFLFHRLRRTDRQIAVEACRSLLDTLVVHDFDARIVRRMINLVESTRIRGRDAVHAATALECSFDTIVSVDTDFDGIPGLSRIDPADLARPEPR